jgi:hypothetical protein
MLIAFRRPHVLATAETAGNKQAPVPVSPANDDIALLDDYSRTIVSAVDRVTPSVVNIESRANGSRGGSWLRIHHRAGRFYSDQQPRRAWCARNCRSTFPTAVNLAPSLSETIRIPISP